MALNGLQFPRSARWHQLFARDVLVHVSFNLLVDLANAVSIRLCNDKVTSNGCDITPVTSDETVGI
jgi:hypothetical protein